jgi:hypothetical protein
MRARCFTTCSFAEKLYGIATLLSAEQTIYALACAGKLSCLQHVTLPAAAWQHTAASSTLLKQFGALSGDCPTGAAAEHGSWLL